MATKSQFVNLQGTGAIGQITLKNFATEDVFTYTERITLDVSNITAGKVYICEQTDSEGNDEAGIYAYSGTNEKWIKVGGQSKITHFVTDNPITTPPTLDDNIELVIWTQNGENNTRYITYNVDENGDLLVGQMEASTVDIDGDTPDLDQPNTFQHLNTGETVFVDWDGKVTEITMIDDSEFVIDPLNIDAGVPFEVNVLAITGKELVHKSAYNEATRDEDGLEAEVQFQDVDTEKFNLLSNVDLVGGSAFVNTKLKK